MVTWFITSKVDYCNVALAGLPQCDLDRVQSVVNAAARLMADACQYDHVTPLLKELHWLPVLQRVQYKLCVLVHRCLNSTAPRYMTDLTVSVGSTARRRLCSASSADLLLSCHPHVAQLSAMERSALLVRERGTAYRLFFVRPRHHPILQKTFEIIPVWSIFCL